MTSALLQQQALISTYKIQEIRALGSLCVKISVACVDKVGAEHWLALLLLLMQGASLGQTQFSSTAWMEMNHVYGMNLKAGCRSFLLLSGVFLPLFIKSNRIKASSYYIFSLNTLALCFACSALSVCWVEAQLLTFWQPLCVCCHTPSNSLSALR